MQTAGAVGFSPVSKHVKEHCHLGSSPDYEAKGTGNDRRMMQYHFINSPNGKESKKDLHHTYATCAFQISGPLTPSSTINELWELFKKKKEKKTLEDTRLHLGLQG